MKQTKHSHLKMALLAVASAALLTPVVYGQTITPQLNDLILGFRAGSNPGQTLNLEVDLGNIGQFYNAAPGSEIALPALSTADLVATYGAGWYTRADLFWGAVGTAGRITGYNSNGVNVGTATLWATAPNCGPAWNRASLTTQKNASSKIEPMIVAGAPGTLQGATPTANSAVSSVRDATQAGSWTVQDTGVAGTSFGFFNPTVDNFEGTNIVVSQLYEVQPGSGQGTYLGDLILRNTGLSFRKAAPTSAICQNFTVQADTNCTGNVTVDDIDNGSTGLCLLLGLSATGPFPIGTTNVTLTVTDSNGSNSTCTASVTVQGAAPTLSNHGSISQCNPVVTYTAPTVTGGCNTPIGAVICTPASGSTFGLGNTTVTCKAIDAASKTGTVSFVVNITSSAPTVNCPSNIVTSVASASNTTAVVTYTTPSGSGCATPINVVCVPPSGTAFSVGTSNVTCTATDANLATGTCSFTVTVQGAGLSGIIGQVNSLTDPKLFAGRKAALNGSLNRAQGDLNALKHGVPTPKIKQACAQLNAFIARVKIYGRLHIITQTEVDALIAAARAEKVAIGCP